MTNFIQIIKKRPDKEERNEFKKQIIFTEPTVNISIRTATINACVGQYFTHQKFEPCI